MERALQMRTFHTIEDAIIEASSFDDGRPCVLITINLSPSSDGRFRLRVALDQAESIGEALIKMVRKAEDAAT
jgi:hypothetical protein